MAKNVPYIFRHSLYPYRSDAVAEPTWPILFHKKFGIPTIHGGQMYLQRFAEVAAHKVVLRHPAFTTLVYPYTAPPQAISDIEGTTFKQTPQYQLSQKLNQKM